MALGVNIVMRYAHRMADEPTVSLRERTRQAVREQVMSAAWTLFAERGFDATTVDEIARAAGMSRRSFFRYFPNKEDVLLDRLVERDDAVAAALSARPATEEPWAAIRAALRPLVQATDAHAVRARRLVLMLREPALGALLVERRRRWLATIAPLLATRMGDAMGDGPDGVRAMAVAAAALACLETAQHAWADAAADVRLADLLDEAMDAVARLSAP